MVYTEILLVTGTSNEYTKYMKGMQCSILYGRSELDHFMYQDIQLLSMVYITMEKKYFLHFLLKHAFFSFIYCLTVHYHDSQTNLSQHLYHRFFSQIQKLCFFFTYASLFHCTSARRLYKVCSVQCIMLKCYSDIRFAFSGNKYSRWNNKECEMGL